MIASTKKWWSYSMQDNLLNWNDRLLIVVSVLAIYAGIKAINKLFEVSYNKKKNSLF
jgi:uncharacterized membrane protein